MMRSFKRIGCLALFVVVALSGCGASEETEAEVEADYEQNDNQIGTFMGYECTEDCSGHEAGYGWAEERGITDPDDCGGNSESFEEGCRAYAEEGGYTSSRAIDGSISPSSSFSEAPDPSQPAFKGRVQLNYGSSRYGGNPTSRYRGEVEADGSVRLRNFDGDVMRGYVDPDGSVRLRSFGGDTYRGSVDSDGSMRLRNFDGSEMSGRIEPDGY